MGFAMLLLLAAITVVVLVSINIDFSPLGKKEYLKAVLLAAIASVPFMFLATFIKSNYLLWLTNV